jgi:hypothetical protein
VQGVASSNPATPTKSAFVQREADDELGSFSGSFALGGNFTAMKFHQSFYQRDAEAKAAFAAVQTVLILCERLPKPGWCRHALNQRNVN